jgi:hypothetical protein
MDDKDSHHSDKALSHTDRDLGSTLAELLLDARSHHSTLQIDRFILGAGCGTPYGRYSQCLMELASRWESLKLARFDIEETQLEVAEAIRDFENSPNDSVAAAKHNLKARRLAGKLESQQRHLQAVAWEMARFFDHAIVLRKLIGPLTEERREELDLEKWSITLRRRAALEISVAGTMSQSTMDAIMMLPEKERLKLVRDCQPGHRRDLHEWLKDAPDLPGADNPGCTQTVSGEDVLKLQQ